MCDEFATRVALVNAAAGSGIGSAVVRALLERGVRVMATDRSERRLVRLREAMETRFGADCLEIRTADASDESAVRRSIEDTKAVFGQLDMLVNNVGFNALSTLSNTDLTAWHGVLDGCLTSHFLHIKHAWPYLLEADYPCVVNISSLAAESPTAMGEAAYAAAKAGVLGLTRAAAAEGAPLIRVNAVMPGLIWNDNLARGIPEDYIDRYRAALPLQRHGTPEEVAQTVLYACSRASANTTGAVLRVAC